jgi:hypothetical protein
MTHILLAIAVATYTLPASATISAPPFRGGGALLLGTNGHRCPLVRKNPAYDEVAIDAPLMAAFAAFAMRR